MMIAIEVQWLYVIGKYVLLVLNHFLAPNGANTCDPNGFEFFLKEQSYSRDSLWNSSALTVWKLKNVSHFNGSACKQEFSFRKDFNLLWYTPSFGGNHLYSSMIETDDWLRISPTVISFHWEQQRTYSTIPLIIRHWTPAFSKSANDKKG